MRAADPLLCAQERQQLDQVRGTDPDLHSVLPVLQLAGLNQGASPMPVCAQNRRVLHQHQCAQEQAPEQTAKSAVDPRSKAV